MQPPRHSDIARKRVAIVYHSAAGGTRVVARLLADLLSADHDPRATSIHDAQAIEETRRADFVVLCYPTYFLRPSQSMTEFIEKLAPLGLRRPAYLVTTYELYPENSLRACAVSLKASGMTVTGSASIRAPGTDLTCLFPDWLCAWLYRFEGGLPNRLRSIAREVTALVQRRGRERLPRLKWYTPVAQALQKGFLDGFFDWRERIRILPERCTDCGACIRRCDRGAWEREGGVIRHIPERCELCTRCVHHCPRSAIVLTHALRDNKRLTPGHYAGLEVRARRALPLSGAQGESS